MEMMLPCCRHTEGSWASSNAVATGHMTGWQKSAGHWALLHTWHWRTWHVRHLRKRGSSAIAGSTVWPPKSKPLTSTTLKMYTAQLSAWSYRDLLGNHPGCLASIQAWAHEPFMIMSSPSGHMACLLHLADHMQTHIYSLFCLHDLF